MAHETDPATTTGHPVEEQRGALRSACDELDKALSEQNPADEAVWVRELQTLMQSIMETLEAHREAWEGVDGALAELILEKPGLRHEVERQEQEHSEMLARVNHIDTYAGRQLEFDEFNLELLRLEAAVVRALLRLHLFRSDDLVYEAYFRVEGGEQG